MGKDRLSIFGSVDDVTTVEMNGRYKWTDFIEHINHMREEQQILRYDIEKGIIGGEFETDINDINLDIDPDHEIEK